MVLGVFGLTLGLGAGGVLLLGVLDYTLQRIVDTEALRTADTVARLAAADALPDPLPVAGGPSWVQVVDAQGRVVAASIDADRLVPMLPVDRIDQGVPQRTEVSGQRLGLDGRVRVVAVPVGTTAEPLTVLVGKSTTDVDQSVRVVRNLLVVAFPLFVALLAVVAWRVVGAALRPVEALRSGAAEITGSARTGRLPVPASHDEIHRLAVTLNDMLDRLASARDRQRAFVADAAHELRSPLTNMRTELEVAQRLGDRTDWSTVSENLLTDTERLSRLVDDLLLLARLDATESPPRSRPVELNALLTAVAARYPSPPVRGEAATGEPAWTEGDPDELHRVLTNLVDNAVRHARTAVSLAVQPHVDGVREAAYHRVTVTDDGPGVPPADRERVFGRFTRLDDARARDAGGAGLGLAIVRDLVRRTGGRVELADLPDAPGLRVTVHLPARATPPPPPPPSPPCRPEPGC
ncbi:HAMP domain-containing sensor histidine kinase [Micromonospora sp. NPDC000207]|uniref:sensor histidine kinase n=1 Tax=Micromonospora sp. NPDC000207 TaxID=3154246 RepID=UPI00332A59B1